MSVNKLLSVCISLAGALVLMKMALTVSFSIWPTGLPLRQPANEFLAEGVMAGVYTSVRMVWFADNLLLLIGFTTPVCLALWLVKKWMPASGAESMPKNTLIAYASQTGAARSLAQRFHQGLAQHADFHCLSELNAALVHQYEKVILVVSTYGEGEAPDSARAFERDIMNWQQTANGQQLSVLALGDSSYTSFCAFGHRLAAAFQRLGWMPLADTPVVEVDRMHLPTVESWWQGISHRLGRSVSPLEDTFVPFTVMENRCLNPDKVSRRAHHIRLYRAGADYQVGDVIAIRPLTDTDGVGNEKQAHHHERLYSIASCESGQVDLLVREHRREDGTPGVCSHYLSQLAVGDSVMAELRRHEHFHLTGDVPLILIGAGTGLAPLLGFLRQKQRWHSQTPNWLLFGEQHQQHDHYFAEELWSLQAAGVLTQVEYAWSKDEGMYVQDKMLLQQAELQRWVVELGAHIYVCGSKRGFGESVLTELEQWMTSEQMAQRLHTDLY